MTSYPVLPYYLFLAPPPSHPIILDLSTFPGRCRRTKALTTISLAALFASYLRKEL